MKSEVYFVQLAFSINTISCLLVYCVMSGLGMLQSAVLINNTAGNNNYLYIFSLNIPVSVNSI